MTKDDILRMAREASTKERLPWNGEWVFRSRKELEHFVGLVAEAERQDMRKQGWRQCAVGQKTTQYCGATEYAISAERETCAKLCDSEGVRMDASWKSCADAIRARGQHDR